MLLNYLKPPKELRCSVAVTVQKIVIAVASSSFVFKWNKIFWQKWRPSISSFVQSVRKDQSVYKSYNWYFTRNTHSRHFTMTNFCVIVFKWNHRIRPKDCDWKGKHFRQRTRAKSKRKRRICGSQQKTGRPTKINKGSEQNSRRVSQ